MPRKLVLMSLLLLALGGVSVASARQPRRSMPVITLERTVCFGSCPIYKLAIFSDGTVRYEGIKYVKRVGKARGRISRRQLDQLIENFTKLDYFNLDDSYTPGNKGCPQVATDMPSAITSLTWHGKCKTINHYHGCRGPDALERLTQLEDKIDEAVKINKWIK